MENSPTADNRERLKRALLALQKMQSKLDTLEQTAKEPIAIIGMGCRFPGGVNSPETFWQLLQNKIDAITEVPPERWNIDEYYDPNPEAVGKMYTRYGGFVERIDQFDADFFRITPREAISLDPQQRLLLEVSWEALENAAIAPDRLVGSQTGVFMGIATFDYIQYLSSQGHVNQIDAYLGSGSAHSAAVGRLSYTLGLEGPCVAVDTACSSSLVSVHLACQSLRQRECDLALSGGVHILMVPESNIFYCKARMLAPDGRCKTFDAAADGFICTDGCGVLVLRRLSDALANGDHILALIRGTATNQDGHTSGLTVPNGLSQQAVIRKALENGGVTSSQVSYVEAHGTGTSLGDPIEVGALGAVYGQERSQEQPLIIGSVKTYIGHTAPAAGVAGIIKVALSLQHQEIPANLHFNQPNPLIAWEEFPFKVPTETMPWVVENGNQRLAGVSSFGFAGTNAHVILEEAPKLKTLEEIELNQSNLERPLHILTLSAKTEAALQQLAQRYILYLQNNNNAAIKDVCFTANIGRSHFSHRMGVVATSNQALCDMLTAFTAGSKIFGIFQGQVSTSIAPPEVVFLFTGQGSQYVGMGRELYETQPTFRQTLEQCDKILQPYLQQSLLEVLYPNEESKVYSARLNETVYTQPALFALEYALAKLWQSWGIIPAAVMGHSIGEYVAACVAGVFSLEDGLKLIAERGRLMQTLPESGAMLAVSAEETRVIAVLQPYLDEVSIAALNGPQNLVIAGNQKTVAIISAILNDSGIKTKFLPVSHAFHSPLMIPILADFERIATEITYNSPQIPLCSNVTGEWIETEIATPQYWVNHIRQPVQFAKSMATLYQQGYKLFLEIGAKPTLLGMGCQCLPDEVGLWLPSLRQEQGNWQELLQSLGQLYVRGIAVDWHSFDQDYRRHRLHLPTYPWQRQRYWPKNVGSEEVNNKGLSTFGSSTTKNTPTIELLQRGNTQSLIEQLEQSGKFSEDDKKLIPKMLEVLIQQHQQQSLALSIKDWFYEIEWRSDERKNTLPTKTAKTPTHWLIFADRRGLGQQLQTHLQARGDAGTLVFPGKTYEQLTEQTYQIDPNNHRDFQQLIASVKGTLQGVIHLWSLDANDFDILTATDLEAISQKNCGSTLHLVQVLLTAELPNSPQLYLITQGAVAVNTDGLLSGLAQSPLWGLGKVITLEHPELQTILVDLDPQAIDTTIPALFEELTALASDDLFENQIAYRNKIRYVPRLARYSKTSILPKPVTFRDDATYLITGGLGGLGLMVADWMVSQGVKHLVLVGRSAPNTTVKQQLIALEQAGAEIVVKPADISIEEQVAQVLLDIEQSQLPLRGIIHTAGVLDDGILQQLSWERFTKVMAPKVAGAWHLHRLTEHQSIDFFVVFSSTASLIGSTGQANYSAANAFLDALAHYRSAQGLAGLSIQWGAWTEAGMAVKHRVDERIETIGMGTITPPQGLRALEYLLTDRPATQIAVTPIDWLQLMTHTALSQLPFLRDFKPLIPPVPVTVLPKTENVLSQLEQVPSTEHSKILTVYLQKQVANAIRMDVSQLDVQKPLNMIGIDSLMAVELRNTIRTHLGVEVRIGKILAGVSVSELAMLITEQWTNTTAQIKHQSALLDLNQGRPPNNVDTESSITKIDENNWVFGEI